MVRKLMTIANITNIILVLSLVIAVIIVTTTFTVTAVVVNIMMAGSAKMIQSPSVLMPSSCHHATEIEG